jgi:serine/threonine-protein kinase
MKALTHRSGIRILAIVIAISGAWLFLRVTLGSRMADAAQLIDGTFAALIAILLFAGLFDARQFFATWRKRPSRNGLTSCGPYEVIRLLGEGSMSAVYLARHRQLKRTVALKRLKPHAQSDELAARFDREVQLASQLAHPNIITILDHGHAPGGGFYYTMEYIRGLTLTQWVEQYGPVVPARAVRVLRQICAAIAAMHERDLLHRDIKPDNVMAYAAHDDYDLIKLLDFGLIKDLNLVASRDLTREVRVLGTPAFMAPERVLDPRVVDVRTDLYGIGCIGFFLLTGRKPFEATLESDLMRQIQYVEAPLVSMLSPFPIPAALNQMIAGTLAKDMARRPASAGAIIEALDEIGSVVPWQREKARLWWQKLTER